MRRAVFLDRDGVINVEVSYLSKADDTILIPSAARAIEAVHRMGMLAIVVTNQSGVARNMYTPADVDAIHARIQRLLLAISPDAAADAFYCCIHHPEYTGKCSCRKPEPGLLLQAQRDFDIDMKNSFMIGDRLSDLQAGSRAGCRNSILVRTGYGVNAEKEAVDAGFPIAADICDAVKSFCIIAP